MNDLEEAKARAAKAYMPQPITSTIPSVPFGTASESRP